MDYEERIKRYKEIMLMRKDRWRLREIGEHFGITRQRIFRIIKDGEPKLVLYTVGETVSSVRPVSIFKQNGILEPEGKDRTRMLVRIRDKFTCQYCGKVRTYEDCKKTGLYMFDVHHLNGLCGKKSLKYDKVSEIDGLITLCHKCHFNHPEHSLRIRKPLEKSYLEDIKENSNLAKDSEWFQEMKMRGL